MNSQAGIWNLLRLTSKPVLLFTPSCYLRWSSLITQQPWGFPGDSTVKNPPAIQETWVPSLCQEDPWRKKWQSRPVANPTEDLVMLQSTGSQRLGHDSTHAPQAITQAMESSVVIKNGGCQPACVWWAPYFLRAVLTFLLCTDQDAGWTSLLPPLRISLFLLGPFSWQLRKGQWACWKRVPNFPLARDCGPTLERTISVLSAGTMGAATDASRPRDAPSCSPC